MVKRNNTFDVAFVTDGNASIGLAHVRRCATLALALKEVGSNACFIVSDKTSEEEVRKLGFPVFSMDTDYRLLSSQADVIMRQLSTYKVPFAFFDSYFSSNELFSSVGKEFLVGCFGYGKKYNQGMHLIVSYGVSSDLAWHEEVFHAARTKVLFGPKYVPLGASYRKQPARDGSAAPMRLMVSTGSSDPLDITSALVQCIRGHGIEIDIDVVIGQFYNVERVKANLQDVQNVRFHEGVENLSQLMQTVEVAVSAGGLTLYELMASSVPTIAYAFVDNQLGNRLLDGAVRWCGDIRKDESIDPQAIKNIVLSLESLIADKEARMQLVASGQRVCDGQGALRIAREIQEQAR